VVKSRSYYEKIVVTGNIIEVRRYEKLNTKGGGNKEGSGEHKEQNYRQQMKRRRNRIRHLVCSNFDSTSKFVTLTFNDSHDFNITDVISCNQFFKKFVLRLRYRYPDFKYVAVIEFQDKNGRGAVHYHMICNLPYLRKSELAKIWGGGFVKINAIDKVDNVGAYVVKYMTEDMDDTRLCGLNAYLHSRGLQEPVELCTWRDDDRIAWESLHELIESETPSYAATYESENAGSIEYRQYNLNRNKTITEN
jgi:hypothetical protein